MQVGEQVPADIVQNFLGGAHHGLGVAQGGKRAHGVNGGGQGDPADQAGDAAAFQNAVDHRFDHIGAQQVSQCADGGKHPNQPQHELVAAQVVQKYPDGAAEMLRLFTAECLCHPRHLLSSGMRKFPGRWCHLPAAPCGCRWRALCRHPESRSCRRPSPR